MRQRRAPHSFFFFLEKKKLFKAASHSALFCLAVHENYIIKDIWHIRGYIHCSELLIYKKKQTTNTRTAAFGRVKQMWPDTRDRNKPVTMTLCKSTANANKTVFFFFFSLYESFVARLIQREFKKACDFFFFLPLLTVHPLYKWGVLSSSSVSYPFKLQTFKAETFFFYCKPAQIVKATHFLQACITPFISLSKCDKAALRRWSAARGV